MDKNNIRLEVKKQIENLSREKKERESKEVSKNLIELLGREKFQTLISYDPLDDEINISAVNQWAKNIGKEVIILDQKLREIPLFTEDEIICIVPGRAFTRDGKRLGRGIGFYDRLLTKNPHMITIGVCFSPQICQNLPEDPWDKRVSQVVFDGNALE